MLLAEFAMFVGVFVIVFSIGIMFSVNQAVKGCPVKQKPPQLWKLILLYTGIFAFALGLANQFGVKRTEVIAF
jgi:hypothetical protein